jgi:hypothetical protein
MCAGSSFYKRRSKRVNSQCAPRVVRTGNTQHLVVLRVQLCSQQRNTVGPASLADVNQVEHHVRSLACRGRASMHGHETALFCWSAAACCTALIKGGFAVYLEHNIALSQLYNQQLCTFLYEPSCWYCPALCCLYPSMFCGSAPALPGLVFSLSQRRWFVTSFDGNCASTVPAEPESETLVCPAPTQGLGPLPAGPAEVPYLTSTQHLKGRT